jgi:cell division protein FtsB
LGRRITDVSPVNLHTIPSWQAIGVLITLLLNFGAGIWGAATLSSSLSNLQQVVVSLEAVVDKLRDNQAEAKARLGILESKVDDLKKDGTK